MTNDRKLDVGKWKLLFPYSKASHPINIGTNSQSLVRRNPYDPLYEEPSGSSANYFRGNRVAEPKWSRLKAFFRGW